MRIDRCQRGWPASRRDGGTLHGPWITDGFGNSFNKAKARAGLSERDLHFHDLHGTAATKFYKAGLSERVIAEIMGWEEQSVSRIIRRYVGRAAATQATIEQLAKGGTRT
jgi:integrase